MNQSGRQSVQWSDPYVNQDRHYVCQSISQSPGRLINHSLSESATVVLSRCASQSISEENELANLNVSH